MKSNKIILSVCFSALIAAGFTSCDKKTEPVLTVTTPSYPRSLISANGKVYVSLFDGHVAQLDTTSLSVEKTVAVGSNPEGIAFANNKIYVANSGGLSTINDSTISVIDPVTFKEIKRIKVVIDPVVLKADAYGDLYLISMGNYSTIPYTLQRIEAATTEKVSVIQGLKPYNMTLNGDNVYLYSYDYDANYNVVNKSYSIYDVKSQKVTNSNFIASSAVAKTPYSIDVNPATKDIYIGETDFLNNGKMYCFGQDGILKFSFDAGLNPTRTIFTNSNKGLFVLNQGKYKGNNAGLNYYDLTASTNYNDYFTTKNNRGLGDTGQDAIRYGSKLYIAVYNSSLIEVINASTGVSIKTIPMVTITTK
ncbi:MAG: hypothetical protein Q8904_08045 [Bacteroidota bacterium]|nr:hypothetical protein [Bacteroidota bacterium]